MSRESYRGFTLVELVVVIAILAVLAAVAAPRFFSLQAEARKSAINGLRAAVGSAAVMANALQSAQGLSAGQAITVEGNSITMVNGWPDTTVATGLAQVIRFDSSAFSTSGANPMTFQVRSAPTAATCSFTYTNATATVPAIVSTPNTAGC
jgi:MSHA pilin protein MshA